jgi:hypothetical protein
MASTCADIALAAILAAAPSTIDGAEARLAAAGTEFVLTLPDGRTLRSQDLVGAVLRIGAPGREIGVTIASIEEDLRAIGGRVVLHRFEVKDKKGHSVPLCSLDADGRNLGFPVPDEHGGFDIACTSGAIGKCVRWGYRAWEEREGGPPLRALHRACVHMVRADYGGDGSPGTRDGTTIVFCDRFGIQPCERDAVLAFEAAWGVDGATCVARTRVAEIVPLERVIERYSRLRGRVGTGVCNEDRARDDPAALLFNWSAKSQSVPPK